MQKHLSNLKCLFTPTAALAASVDLAQSSEAAVTIGAPVAPIQPMLVALTWGADR